MLARLLIIPVIVLGFAFWVNQINVAVTGATLVPEIVAVGGGYAQTDPAPAAPVLLAQGQLLFQ